MTVYMVVCDHFVPVDKTGWTERTADFGHGNFIGPNYRSQFPNETCTIYSKVLAQGEHTLDGSALYLFQDIQAAPTILWRDSTGEKSLNQIVLGQELTVWDGSSPWTGNYYSSDLPVALQSLVGTTDVNSLNQAVPGNFSPEQVVLPSAMTVYMVVCDHFVPVDKTGWTERTADFGHGNFIGPNYRSQFPNETCTIYSKVLAQGEHTLDGSALYLFQD